MTFSKRAWTFGFGLLLSLVPVAGAAGAQPTVGLGTADPFAVLGGSTVTNTGPSVVNGDLGLSPGTAVTGFPPGTLNGTFHVTDAVAAQAQSDATTAYNDAAGRTPSTVAPADIGGQVLKAGVYKSAAAMGLTGDVTLDAEGDPSAVFIFQIGSALTTASSSRVVLANGADSCNIFWQVGSSATLGTNSQFRGTVIALTSVTATTGATIEGRALARNGAVTLDSNTITRSGCASAAAGTPTPSGPAPGGGTSPGAGTTAPGAGTTTPGSTGTATLTPGTPRAGTCMGGFRATVRGRHIRSVRFSLDGRRLVTALRSPFSAGVRVLRGGRHWVRARVTFSDATRPRTVRFRYRACTAARKAVPRFAG